MLCQLKPSKPSAYLIPLISLFKSNYSHSSVTTINYSPSPPLDFLLHLCACWVVFFYESVPAACGLVCCFIFHTVMLYFSCRDCPPR